MPPEAQYSLSSLHPARCATLQARQAGISVSTKGAQLWNVGHGLPLDAIKKSRITAWKCTYEISDFEVVSLVDALGKNESLTHLDLSLAGLEWTPPGKSSSCNKHSSPLSSVPLT